MIGLRVWLSTQHTLAALVADLEARSDRLVRALRQAEVERVAEASDLREQLAALRREATRLDAANQAAYGFADRLPAPFAAELRGLLTPPLDPKGTNHAN